MVINRLPSLCSHSSFDLAVLDGAVKLLSSSDDFPLFMIDFDHFGFPSIYSYIEPERMRVISKSAVAVPV